MVHKRFKNLYDFDMHINRSPYGMIDNLNKV